MLSIRDFVWRSVVNGLAHKCARGWWLQPYFAPAARTSQSKQQRARVRSSQKCLEKMHRPAAGADPFAPQSERSGQSCTSEHTNLEPRIFTRQWSPIPLVPDRKHTGVERIMGRDRP